MRRKSYLLGILLSIFFLTACNNKSGLREEPYSKESFSLGTYIRIRIYDEGKEETLQLAFDRINELEEKLTTDSENQSSEIEQINRQAGIQPVKVSPDVYQLVKTAANYSKQSDGGFNYMIGAITQLWRIGREDARKPEQDEIDEALKKVDFHKVSFSEEEQTIFLQESGMQIDLGAIAKGYITDEVVKTLKKQGVTSAILDLGGNIYVLGNNPNQKDGRWNVGVQDPNLARGVTIGSLKTTNQTIVTSGIYERKLEIGNQVYHHIFDSTTGYPHENDLASVSIITDQSIDGDALSTLVYSKGIKAGLEYVEQKTDASTSAIFVSKDNQVYVTKGLEDNFKLSKGNGYTLGDRKNLD
ncbi:FAD:protein FMN transferase [Candidatus Enterococcus ferrettii]|uniref:FAD:protein FMN transferase n=1 Tax=Candidatus Enterococcus ferrettii TaxID=2815324 RepID=A0ABV0EQM7_9ENTE|nr:FAD:protein FMN transferase [Enterococcus sp. 665A]MBO1342680.1 FAD:protein FMN transferase [Enterococcus sp. 665A]